MISVGSKVNGSVLILLHATKVSNRHTVLFTVVWLVNALTLLNATEAYGAILDSGEFSPSHFKAVFGTAKMGFCSNQDQHVEVPKWAFGAVRSLPWGLPWGLKNCWQHKEKKQPTGTPNYIFFKLTHIFSQNSVFYTCLSPPATPQTAHFLMSWYTDKCKCAKQTAASQLYNAISNTAVADDKNEPLLKAVRRPSGQQILHMAVNTKGCIKSIKENGWPTGLFEPHQATCSQMLLKGTLAVTTALI